MNIFIELLLLSFIPVIFIYYFKMQRLVLTYPLILVCSVFIYYHDNLTELKKDNFFITFLNVLFDSYQSFYFLFALILLYLFSLCFLERVQSVDSDSSNLNFFYLFSFLFFISFGFLESFEFCLSPLKFSFEVVNDQLVNPMMLFHPVLLYCAYAYILVLGYLFFNFISFGTFFRFKVQFIRVLVNIMVLLGLSLLFSVLWSWDINSLSWTWDPIEGVLMFIYVLSLLLLHLFSFNRFYYRDTTFQLLLFKLFWFSPIFSVLLVRTGTLDSVHTFSMAGSFNFFISIFLIMALISISMVAERRSYKNLLAGSVVYPTTVIVFLLLIILLLGHAFYPNLFGAKLDPEEFENIAVTPLLLLIAFLLLILPSSMTNSNNIRYIALIVITIVAVYLTSNLTITIITGAITLLMSKIPKSHEFKVTHTFVFIITLTISIAVIIHDQTEISLELGQKIKSDGYELILHKIQFCKENTNYYTTVGIAYSYKTKLENLLFTISTPYGAEISKSRIYLTILGHWDQTIKTIINNNLVFLKITKKHTPLINTATISTLLYITIIKNKKENKRQT